MSKLRSVKVRDEEGIYRMSASAEDMVRTHADAPARALAARPRIALTSPLIAYSAAAAGSIAVWVGLFKLVFS